MHLSSEGRHSCRPVLLIVILLSALAGVFVVHSGAPRLEHVHPVGFARGSTNAVKMSGKADPWPPKIWVQGDGVQITASTNKNELQFVVASDAAPGARLFRLFNSEGASEPLLFVVSDGPESVETEPNNHFNQPMFIETLPVHVNGRLDKSEDVDSFQLKVPAGHRLIASVESYVLMSKLDAVLRLVDTEGHQLAWNHDSATIDPRLDWWSEEDTDVVLQVFGFAFPATASVRLTGGSGAIYRLHLSITNGPGTEPARERPSKLSLPSSVRANFREPGAQHRFKLPVLKDERISIRADAESLGSPLDAWLAIENGEGKQLARNDDANGSRDPAIDWKATEDGEHTIVIGSLTRNVGTEFFYELHVQSAVPDWSTSLSVSSLVAKPGSTNEVKLTFNPLRGFTNEIRFIADNLPEGVTCVSVTAPGKGGEVKLSLVTCETAPEWQGPIRFFVHDTVADIKRVIPFTLTATSVNNGVPGGYRVLLAEELDHAWLTVLPKEDEQSESDDD